MNEQDNSAQTFFVTYWPALIYAIAAALSIGVFLADTERSVSHWYEDAANDWIESNSLYDHSIETGHGFLYLPHAAILHTPYALVNQWLGGKIFGEILWRLVSWCVFTCGVWRLTRAIICDSEEMVQWRVAIVVGLLGLSCIRIGQSTLIMGGLMMLSIEAWHFKRFNLAAALITLAIAFKPLALVLAMLLFALSRPMKLRLAIGGLALAVFPFLTQSYDYVISQYLDCYRMLGVAAELGDNREWAQLFGMLRVFGLSFTPATMNSIRIVAALSALVVMLVATLKLPRNRQAGWLLAVTMVYLMLFNPRTENSTYCLVAPVFGLFMAQLWVGGQGFQLGGRVLSVLLFAASILTAGSYEIGKKFTPAGSLPIWLAPLCCCFLCVVLSALFLVELRHYRENDSEEVSG